MWFSSYLYQRGLITGDQFAEAVVEQLARRPLLGKLAISLGVLTLKQVMQIFAAQADDLARPFGQVAIDLDFLTKLQLNELLQLQADSVPDLAEILVDQGAITEEQITIARREARQTLGHAEPMANETVSEVAV